MIKTNTLPEMRLEAVVGTGLDGDSDALGLCLLGIAEGEEGQLELRKMLELKTHRTASSMSLPLKPESEL